jgi:small subunit ribosomal protein S1
MMNYGVFIELEEGVEGLIHISEISWTRHIKHPSDIFKVGDKVEAKILNIDHEEKKISLGIKQLTENPWDTIENKYQIGTDHEGIVRNLTQFGAFIELEEGIDGLVHVSDMSWVQLVRHPKDILKNGDKVNVRILDVSTEDRRLSLGIKQVEENPWDLIREEYPSGKMVKGTVLKVLDKGIIFTLADNMEGIVPLKRMKESQKKQLFEKFKEGDTYDVTVQEVDEEYKKIILMIDIDMEDEESGVDKKTVDSKLKDVESENIENQEEIIDESEPQDFDTPADEET